MTDATPLVSIVITTRNRKADVLRALESCFMQSYPSLEVLVYDDASSDGTSQAVADHFPQVRLLREESRQGYIVLRNRGLREARGQYIFSIDDDAYYTHPNTLEPVVDLFEQSPKIAAVAMPYIEPGRADEGVFTSSGSTDVRSFVGCAHALRKSAVLNLGGYREFLIHQGEERDLCIRLLDRGYRIALGDSSPIVHCPSPIRDRFRMERYAIRNTFLFDVLNIPLPQALPRLAIDAIHLLTWMPNWPMTFYRAYYVLCGLGSCLKHIPERHAVSNRTYSAFRTLPLHGPSPWEPGMADSLTPTEGELCSSSN